MTGLSFKEFPFTDAELTAAFTKVMSADDAKAAVCEFRANVPLDPRSVYGFAVSVGMLELIASVSDDLARRVQEYRDRARQNPPSSENR